MVLLIACLAARVDVFVDVVWLKGMLMLVYLRGICLFRVVVWWLVASWFVWWFVCWFWLIG